MKLGVKLNPEDLHHLMNINILSLGPVAVTSVATLGKTVIQDVVDPSVQRPGQVIVTPYHPHLPSLRTAKEPLWGTKPISGFIRRGSEYLL
jgi:hypothetical protein